MKKIKKVLRPINKVLIHCTATKPDHDVDVKDIRQWHLDRGWSDCAYHYHIKLDGTIQSGRPIELIGAHCRGYNKFSIGISYAGGLDENGKPSDTRTEEQKESLVKLMIRIRKVYPEISVHGHNEFSNKACPSFDVQAEEY
jgi:N-acetylmuramoyl-L-alanine amidase